MVGLKLITDYSLPASGNLSLARVKEHLRVTHSTEDDLITGYLWAAIRHCEEATGLSALVATYQQTIDRFPSYGYPVRLLRWPAVALSAIQYLDADGVSQTLDTAAVVLDADTEPARVWIASGTLWPESFEVRSASVSITYTAGFASNALIPPMFLQAVYLLVGHWYANRESVVVGMTANTVPAAADALLSLLKPVEYDYEPQTGYK